jgi:hypothetical protein
MVTAVLLVIAGVVILAHEFSAEDRDKAWAVLFAVIGFWLGASSR